MDLETFRAIDVDIDLANDFVPDVILSANDYNGRCIVARVTNGGVSVNGDNLSARLLFNTAPGISAGGYVTMTRVASSPTATWQVPVPSDALVARQVMLCVQIVDSDDNLVCSRNFRGIVDRKLMDDGAPESVNELNRLWEGIDALENIDASVAADGTVSVTAPDGTVTTSTAVPTAVSAATAATNAANTAAGAANTAATDAAQAVADLQAFVPLDADNILKASDTGAIVSTSDSYPSPLLGLTAYGNSVQDGTPTPEAPVPIKSVHAGRVCTAGKNIIAMPAEASREGITWSYDDAGQLLVNGTATSPSPSVAKRLILPAGTYTLVGPTNGAGGTAAVTLENENTHQTVAQSRNPSEPATFTLTEQATMYQRFFVYQAHGAYTNFVFDAALYAGSSAYPYEMPSTVITPLTLIDDQGVAHELRSLPDGTRDELVINTDGSGTLIENIRHCEYDSTDGGWTDNPSGDYVDHARGNMESYIAWVVSKRCNAVVAMTQSSGNISSNSLNIRIANTGLNASQFVSALNGAPVIVDYVTSNPITYHIPAINMPSLPALASNAWLSCTDADGAAIAADVGITYRRDINKVISDLETAIADIVSA